MREITESASEVVLAKERYLAELTSSFGLCEFRLGQYEAISAVVSGRDAVVVMPTGSGKSLCYQLAALLLEGVTLVVSPLIALMNDQVTNLQARGIAVTYINSTLTGEEIAQRMRGMEQGEYKLVYVAPERFRSAEFRECLRQSKISLVAVDEAHCISQWGHDFRPDYLDVGKFLENMPGVRIMALTATATPSVRSDIMQQLRLGESPRKPPFVEVLGFSRPNLHLAVTECRTGEAKLARVLDLIRRHRTGIVYVATRRHAADVFEQLCRSLPESLGVQVLLYHGAMTDAQRALAQEEFRVAKDVVVVATNAFGMGIDRADIRFVAHWDIPGGVEAYYQEVGRAGRDGKPADCELLFNYFDVKVQEFFVDGANPSVDTALSVFRLMCRYSGAPFVVDTDGWAKELKIRNGIAVATVVNILLNRGLLVRMGEGRAQTYRIGDIAREALVQQIFFERRDKFYRDRRRLRAMVDFAYLKTCRHRYILDYFGDQSPTRKCGGCDICDARAIRAA